MAHFEFDTFYPFTFRNLFKFSVHRAKKGDLIQQDVLRNLQVVKTGPPITYNSPEYSFRSAKDSEIHQLYHHGNGNETLKLEGSIDEEHPGFIFQIRETLSSGSSSSGSNGGKRRKKGTRRRRKNKSKNFSMKRWL